MGKGFNVKVLGAGENGTWLDGLRLGALNALNGAKGQMNKWYPNRGVKMVHLSEASI